MQNTSPERNLKIQLQGVLHDGNNSTFYVVYRVRLPAQMADMNQAKELLWPLLPKFERKINKELEEKNQIM